MEDPTLVCGLQRTDNLETSRTASSGVNGPW